MGKLGKCSIMLSFLIKHEIKYRKVFYRQRKRAIKVKMIFTIHTASKGTSNPLQNDFKIFVKKWERKRVGERSITRTRWTRGGWNKNSETKFSTLLSIIKSINGIAIYFNAIKCEFIGTINLYDIVFYASRKLNSTGQGELRLLLFYISITSIFYVRCSVNLLHTLSPMYLLAFASKSWRKKSFQLFAGTFTKITF